MLKEHHLNKVMEGMLQTLGPVATQQFELECIRKTADKASLLGLMSIESHVKLKQFVTSGQDPSINELLNKVKLLSSYGVNDPVLILGESGTGKEIIASALHGSRSGKFIPINCTSLPDTLIESLLFGHVKGSFTGATENKVGAFQAAHNGTLFLDEIGDMPLNMQTKLLRVLQEGKVTPVGSNDEIVINCRIVAATNQEDLLDEDMFRNDLYWRLSTIELTIPPLRYRCQEDIKAIINSLDPNKEFPLDEFLSTMQALSGNVRELQQYVRRYLLLGEKGYLLVK